MGDDLSRLDADSDVCLAFLIAHQEEWGPTMANPEAKGPDGRWQQRPLRLIAVERPRSADQSNHQPERTP